MNNRVTECLSEGARGGEAASTSERERLKEREGEGMREKSMDKGRERG